MNLPVALIIEDDEVIAKIFATALEQAEYKTMIIRDGLDALEYIKKNIPDLVVLDLHLPRVHGLTILKSIRSDDRLLKTRVMVATADATVSQFLRDEADLILIKPVGFHQMREMAIRLRPNSTGT